MYVCDYVCMYAYSNYVAIIMTAEFKDAEVDFVYFTFDDCE